MFRFIYSRETIVISTELSSWVSVCLVCIASASPSEGYHILQTLEGIHRLKTIDLFSYIVKLVQFWFCLLLKNVMVLNCWDGFFSSFFHYIVLFSHLFVKDLFYWFTRYLQRFAFEISVSSHSTKHTAFCHLLFLSNFNRMLLFRITECTLFTFLISSCVHLSKTSSRVPVIFRFYYVLVGKDGHFLWICSEIQVKSILHLKKDLRLKHHKRFSSEMSENIQSSDTVYIDASKVV